MTDSADITFYPRPTPVYMIGDSHCLVMNDLLFSENKFFHQTFIARHKYCGTLSAHDFVDDNQALNPKLVSALVEERLVYQHTDDSLHALHVVPPTGMEP